MTAHSTSTKATLLVFTGLAILTGVTVSSSYMGLPRPLAISVAGLIALAKVCLIAAFFMHLRFEKRGIYLVIFTAFFFVAVLVFALIPDIGFLHG
jgi:caa(3)-type oxidase subunit IV